MRVHEGSTRFLRENQDVRVRTKVNFGRLSGKVLRITSVITRHLDLSLIMNEIAQIFNDSSLDCGLLLAAQVTWQNGKREKWISPQVTRFLEILEHLQETHRNLNYLRNNGDAKDSELRYFERAQRVAQGNLLIEMKVRKFNMDTYNLVETEIKNFKKGFNIAI